MLETTVQLLESFDALSPQQKHELLTEMLRRSGELPATFMSDDSLTGLADELFKAMDTEESDDREPGAL